MRRVLAQELSAVRIPKRNLDELGKRFFEHFQFGIRNVLEQQILVGLFLGMFGQEPEVIIRIRHHVGEGEVFILRQVYGKLHIIGRTLVGHQPTHVFLKERLPPHHQVREYSLVRGVISEMLITRKDIVHEGGSASPMSEDEHRVVLQRFGCQELFILLVLQGFQYGKQAAYGFGQAILAAVIRVNRPSAHYFVECFPIGSHQRVHRQFAEF